MDPARTDGEAPAGFDVRLVLDVLPWAIIVTDPVGRILEWNRRAEDLYGWAAAEVVGRLVSDVLVPLPAHEQAAEIFEVVRAGESWEGDFTVLRRDGDPVRAWVTDRPLLNGAGKLVAIVGASEDVSGKRLLEQRAADLTKQLRLALDAGGLGTFRWDMATSATEWDETVVGLFGLSDGGFVGTFDTWVSLVHPDDREDVVATVNAAVAGKGRYTVQHRVVWPDGTVHWLQGSGQVTLAPDGEVTGVIGCVRDVTTQVTNDLDRQKMTAEAIEAAEAERIHRDRLEFLGRINDAIAAASDRRSLAVNVTRAAVPRLGDWCSLFVFPYPDSTVPDIETAHVDPAMVAYARELQERFPYDPAALTGMPNVIRTGEPEFYADIDATVLAAVEATEEQREVVEELVLRSSIAVPLTKRGRSLGGLQLVMANASRRYTLDDLTLAEAVAARIASALDNMRLAEQQRTIASTLQASLLPHHLPQIPGFEVAVRYWANGENVEVGGDFYDLIELTADAWAVVIGDVCGTGPAAAAVTGLARHTIASAAWHGDDHATVLRNLNTTMRRRETGPFCTALYGTLHRDPNGATFTFACGGHPLPIHVRAEGGATSVGTPGTALGLFDAVKATTTTISVAEGDTLVLYTDGATDVAPPHGLSAEDFTDLAAAASKGARSAEDVADRLHAGLSRIFPIEQRHDDIALLVLRRVSLDADSGP